MQTRTEMISRFIGPTPDTRSAQKQFLIHSARTSIPLVFISTLLAAALVSAAPPTLPDTPAGHILEKWLDAFNSGDRARMIAFAEVHMPDRLQKMDGAVDFRKGTGGFDLYSIEKSQPLEIEAIVHEREGNRNYARLQMKVSSGEPARVTSLGVRVIDPPSGAPQLARLSQDEAVSAWKAEIEKAAAAGNFSGAWLWSRNGQLLASGAVGLADLDKNVPNSADTQFRLGSMNKMFTAVAILQLVSDGKLSLDDTLGKHLPDYPNRDLAAKVKVRHLLSHTGGTGDIFGPEFDARRLQLRALQDYVDLYGKRPLKFEPGARWDYSNYGFILLGRVIEKVSGQSYYEYVREHIFTPAGMTATDSLPESETVAKRATGYMKEKETGQWAPNTGTLPWRGTSAGGGYSTVADLNKFANALLSHKLVSAELLAQATREEGNDQGYGFGFQVMHSTGTPSFGHGGGAPGMNGMLTIFPDSGQVVVVLSNLDPPAASRISDWLGARMPLR